MQTTNMAVFPDLKTSTWIDPKLYFTQIQLWLDAGKALETITANQLQQAVGGSYQHALDILEELDAYIACEREQASGLVFPFNLINQMHNNYMDAWRVMVGMGSQSKEIEAQTFNEKLAEVEQNLLVLNEQLNAKQVALDELEQAKASELQKAVKAKQTAQQNARKAKAELTAASKENTALAKELKALQSTLSTQQSEHDKTKSDYEKLVSDMEQQAKQQVEAQRHRVEELNQQLEQVSRELEAKNQQLAQHHENQGH
ncbi:hypothetical protein A3K86_20935 [Photobacterium jeanii]|uniref:KfrA N-terminal DNA-binding domain-containing protein n=1 Tax=Photobacterium jeanii TaxID=858640 RepID=A0A178K3Y5_9GAMM|nr:hypothetical protein [Photobacterium jeanii]OAN11413.1 hypothetical protein A3K86_20935 [Photobacterium jeanii]PST90932.1 hypothetical protein C9I91_10040 [Photobacterium jeanii]